MKKEKLTDEQKLNRAKEIVHSMDDTEICEFIAHSKSSVSHNRVVFSIQQEIADDVARLLSVERMTIRCACIFCVIALISLAIHTINKVYFSCIFFICLVITFISSNLGKATMCTLSKYYDEESFVIVNIRSKKHPVSNHIKKP